MSVAPPPPLIVKPSHASNELKYRFDLGQVVDGRVSPVDVCYYSTGGYDGTLYNIAGKLLIECVMCKETI